MPHTYRCTCTIIPRIVHSPSIFTPVQKKSSCCFNWFHRRAYFQAALSEVLLHGHVRGNALCVPTLIFPAHGREKVTCSDQAKPITKLFFWLVVRQKLADIVMKNVHVMPITQNNKTHAQNKTSNIPTVAFLRFFKEFGLNKPGSGLTHTALNFSPDKAG